MASCGGGSLLSGVGRGLLAILAIIVALATAWARENLDAGKSGPALFAATCSACHNGPQGLSKGMDARSLAGFLRQHYTTSPATAGELAGYLLSVRGDPRRANIKQSPAEEPSQSSKAGPSTAGRPPADIPGAPPRAGAAAEPTAAPTGKRRHERAGRRPNEPAGEVEP